QIDLTKDTVLVTADHGHRDSGGHGGDEPACLSVPMVAAGAGIRAGRFGPARLVDVAPTVAALLGLPVPAASQGQPLVDMLSLERHAQATLLERVAGQRQRIEQMIRMTIAHAAARDALLRGLRVGLLALGLIGSAVALRRAGAGRSELLAALAYLI